MDIAILDSSAEAHMPDTIIMPYKAKVRHAGEPNEKRHLYRLAGNTCLAGDIMGDYRQWLSKFKQNCGGCGYGGCH